jgi:hypothetical protein
MLKKIEHLLACDDLSCFAAATRAFFGEDSTVSARAAAFFVYGRIVVRRES